MAAAPKLETWSAPGLPLRIEYAANVLDEIRAVAVDGYHRVPHGGVETGGVLFGTRQKNGVRVTAWRPVRCEYTKGPSFLLSEQEERALEEQLAAWRSTPELAGLEPVGWYRAHNRSEILLSDADLSFYNRFFPEIWQIGLIVRPASFAPTRAGFFVREADGRIRTQSSYHEFVVPARGAASADRLAAGDEPIHEAPAEPRAAEGAAPVHPGPVAPEAVKPLILEAPEPSAPRKTNRRWKWPLVATVMLVIGAAGVLGFWWWYQSARGLSLAVSDTSGELHIAWDRSAPAIRRSIGGEIEILDGGVRTERKLSAADLRSGSLTYARESGDVELRLMVYLPGSAPVAEITHFLKPGQPASAPRQAPETALVRPEAPPVAQPPAQQKPVVPPAIVPPAPGLAKRTAVPFRPPPPNRRQARSDMMPTLAPPVIDAQTANPPAAALPSVLGPPVPGPAPIAAAAPPRPAGTAPPTGRIVWTGRLPKDGRLVIQGYHASTGSLNGALPARALSVSAYPAELTSAGITVYTRDAKYARPVTEAAGADNGWNRTTYTLDNRRAAAISVIDLPNARNGYKLVLEGNSPKLSIVVLEWHAQ